MFSLWPNPLMLTARLIPGCPSPDLPNRFPKTSQRFLEGCKSVGRGTTTLCTARKIKGLMLPKAYNPLPLEMEARSDDRGSCWKWSRQLTKSYVVHTEARDAVPE